MNTSGENLILKDIASEMKDAYLDYSMSVIAARALPDVRDGLKPVHRRILYTMYGNGLYPEKPFRKCADTVGNVLGQYHPHGDASVYDALVRMAQDFSLRYPLVHGHGNFGSVDGDPPAAYRYTESKMSKISMRMLTDIDKETVDFMPNYDARLQEPVFLPSRFPNLLVNGSTGIAVGMATNIPPHNLGEVIDGACCLLDNPNAGLDQLMEHIKGPDFPTGGIIMGRSGIRAAYATGRGKIILRAKTHIEQHKNGRERIIVTEIPYMVNKARLIERIADLVKEKKVDQISNIRDESSRKGMKIVIELKRDANAQIVLNQLYSFTQLQDTVGVTMLALVKGEPKTLSLKQMLEEYIKFQEEIITRRTIFDLKKAKERAHILEGLLVAFLNIDEVIEIIRNEDEPKPALMSRFGLTETQAEAILELKLRHLAKLEEMKIRGEQSELEKERDQLQGILASERKMNNLLKKELQADAQAYGDERRSPLQEREEAKAMSEHDMLPSEPVTIVLSQMGWVRSAKGHDIDAPGLNYKAGDSFKAAVKGKSNQPVVFVDSTGRSYAIDPITLPSARGQGEPLTGKLTLPPGATVDHMLMESDDQKLLMASDAGYGFVCTFNDLVARNRAGKALITLPENAHVMPPVVIEDASDMLLAITQAGRMLMFPVSDLPQLSKGKGNKIINIPSAEAARGEDGLAQLYVLPPQSTLTIHVGKRKIKLRPEELQKVTGERGRRGTLMRGLQRIDRVEIDSPRRASSGDSEE